MIKYFIFFFAIIGVYACKQDHEHGGHGGDATNHQQPPVIQIDADIQTAEMIEKVKTAVSRINPDKITYYLNATRAKRIEQEMQTLTGPARINASVRYAQELLNAGQTDLAIQTFSDLILEIEKLDGGNKEESVHFLKKNLAIAYLRKGEQENCLVNHTNESCIIPIGPKAIHQLRDGSSNAIRLFNEVLAAKPDDMDSKYLLNIAHMTLGQYPDGVQEQYRIPSAYFDSNPSFPVFKDIAMDLGVDMTALSGGTCVDDFNGDGYLDIIASSWGFSDQIKYFENDQQGGFIDKTLATGLKGVSGGLNLRHADFNNDGHLDFIILRGAWFFDQGQIPNSLIRNNGDGTFTDVTISSGIYSEYPTQTAVWSDFDLDGQLDLFIANESNSTVQYPCELFMNKGDGTFVNKTVEAGISVAGFFKGVACGDLNNDGYSELYISTLGSSNILFMNKTGLGKLQFDRVGPEANMGAPRMSFPTWIFDYNNDGWQDIFVSGYSHGKTTAAQLLMEGITAPAHPSRPYVYRNNGDGTFSEVSAQLGLREPSTTMGCNFGDLDNDGFPDFYLATGEPSLYSIVPNRMYHNVGGTRFEDVTYSGGFGHIQKGHAVGFGDLDLDGDQDIYAVMGGAYEGDVYQNILYENPIGNQNKWVTILLEGTSSNRSAIGAKIVITIDENGSERTIYHTVGIGASFGGNSLLAEIGLGQATMMKTIAVVWPNKERTITNAANIPPNVHLYIKEGDNQVKQRAVKSVAFAKHAGGHKHH
jgi:tetratricopeptide (TPR) repeat protein